MGAGSSHADSEPLKSPLPSTKTASAPPTKKDSSRARQSSLTDKDNDNGNAKMSKQRVHRQSESKERRKDTASIKACDLVSPPAPAATPSQSIGAPKENEDVHNEGEVIQNSTHSGMAKEDGNGMEGGVDEHEGTHKRKSLGPPRAPIIPMSSLPDRVQEEYERFLKEALKHEFKGRLPTILEEPMKRQGRMRLLENVYVDIVYDCRGIVLPLMISSISTLGFVA